MKQFGVSPDQAELSTWFHQEVENAWKDINQEYIKPTAVPMPFLDRVLNLARAIDVIYKYGDGYTHSHLLKDHIASLLVNPMVI